MLLVAHDIYPMALLPEFVFELLLNFFSDNSLHKAFHQFSGVSKLLDMLSLGVMISQESKQWVIPSYFLFSESLFKFLSGNLPDEVSFTLCCCSYKCINGMVISTVIITMKHKNISCQISEL